MPEIYVKVEPDSEEFKIREADFLKVKLENPAENNKANKELIRQLRKRSEEKVGIISGHKSRRKKLRIESDAQEFKKKLLDN